MGKTWRKDAKNDSLRRHKYDKRPRHNKPIQHRDDDDVVDTDIRHRENHTYDKNVN